MKTEQEFLRYIALSLSEINENIESSTISDLQRSVVHRLNKLWKHVNMTSRKLPDHKPGE